MDHAGRDGREEGHQERHRDRQHDRHRDSKVKRKSSKKDKKSSKKRSKKAKKDKKDKKDKTERKSKKEHKGKKKKGRKRRRRRTSSASDSYSSSDDSDASDASCSSSSSFATPSSSASARRFPKLLAAVRLSIPAAAVHYACRVSQAALHAPVPDSDGMNVLHLSCVYGNVEVCDALLRAGASVALPVANGSLRTPLHLACESGHGGICQALLNFGADPSTQDLNEDDAHDLGLKELLEQHRRDQARDEADARARVREARQARVVREQEAARHQEENEWQDRLRFEETFDAAAGAGGGAGRAERFASDWRGEEASAAAEELQAEEMWRDRIRRNMHSGSSGWYSGPDTVPSSSSASSASSASASAGNEGAGDGADGAAEARRRRYGPYEGTGGDDPTTGRHEPSYGNEGSWSSGGGAGGVPRQRRKTFHAEGKGGETGGADTGGGGVGGDGGGAGAQAQQRPTMAADLAATREADVAAWTVFIKSPPNVVTVDLIPWPSGPPDNVLCLPRSLPPQEAMLIVREALRRFHPDKLVQKLGKRVPEGAPYEAVMERVKDVAQQINKLFEEVRNARSRC